MFDCARCGGGVGIAPCNGAINCSCVHCGAPSILALGERHFEDSKGQPLTLRDVAATLNGGDAVRLVPGLVRYDDNGILRVIRPKLENFFGVLALWIEYSWRCDDPDHSHPALNHHDPARIGPQEMRYSVLQSAAGYYLGYFCPVCGPYQRCSGYFATREEAHKLLVEEFKSCIAYYLRGDEEFELVDQEMGSC